MAFPSRPLADKDPLRPWRRLLQQIRMHQPIVYHDLGRPQPLEPAPRAQARIPRSRTADVDDPCATGLRFLRCLHHPAAASTRARDVAAPHPLAPVGTAATI